MMITLRTSVRAFEPEEVAAAALLASELNVPMP
jgi:hypothetical protein